MVRDSITLIERNLALDDFLLEEKRIIKRARRDPLTLGLQFNIARSVGAGAVQRESKKRSLRKIKIKRAELFTLNLERSDLLSRKIKTQPLVSEPLIPKDPLKDNFLAKLYADLDR